MSGNGNQDRNERRANTRARRAVVLVAAIVATWFAVTPVVHIFHRFILPAAAMSTVLTIVVLVAAAVTVVLGILLYRLRGPRPGTCVNCGYELAGNVSGVCPECGARV
jgi:hypothetical protein